jgi:hypothetical protein
MIPVENRDERVRDSARKIESPFAVDPELCLYSPQDNYDSLEHPRIAEWLDFVRTEYVPDLPEAPRRILLFMPCTKTKPYPFSSEHQAINQRLLDSGFEPTERLYLPQELQARLTDGFSPEVLNLSPLTNKTGTVIHRMVISEPMANDTTYQKLGEIHHWSPRGVAVVQDELVSLMESMETKGQESARGFYLSGWNGDSSYTVDRVGRASNVINRLALYVLGGMQPDKLRQYVRDSTQGGNRNDGLIQLF